MRDIKALKYDGKRIAMNFEWMLMCLDRFKCKPNKNTWVKELA